MFLHGSKLQRVAKGSKLPMAIVSTDDNKSQRRTQHRTTSQVLARVSQILSHLSRWLLRIHLRCKACSSEKHKSLVPRAKGCHHRHLSSSTRGRNVIFDTRHAAAAPAWCFLADTRCDSLSVGIAARRHAPSLISPSLLRCPAEKHSWATGPASKLAVIVADRESGQSR